MNAKPRFLGRTGIIFGLYGVVFHGADARDVQERAALQNNTKSVSKLMDSSKNLDEKLFGRREMKCWESSETRFAKVGGLCEPFSRGKQTFKVLHASS